ncbi:MAG: chromosomal replication initiator protein DnaA [Minisyncoccia bacterium]
MTKEEMWQTILAQIQFQISKASFATWFKGTQIVSINNNKIIIGVPNSFSKEWLENKYQNLILKILHTIDESIKSIEFIILSKKGGTKNKKENEIIKTNNFAQNQLEFKEFKINPATNLNPNYKFDNFIVGSFNELAYAACWAVSENPGNVYNPLFIYGGVGLGKTHLLQATGNKIYSLWPDKKNKYYPAEELTTLIVESIKKNEISTLKKKLKEIDVLIVDDTQFLAGKEKTQEEFFHIFNYLYQNQKQIILSSDRPPKAIPALEERLRSRFEGGMICDIGLPDFETRMAILKMKCEQNNILLDQSILEYIALNIQNNIRELEGALNRLIIYSKVNNTNITLETAKKILEQFTNKPPKATNFKAIIQSVASFYNIKEEDLLKNTRIKEIVKPRQIIMYLLRTELNESFPSIGRKFKGKDHTTVMHAFRKIEKELKENENLFQEINLIKQRIYTSSV